MNAIDLSPFYRNSIGFDRLGSLINHALQADAAANSYPPYNIEVLDDASYAITLAVPCFEQENLDIEVENGVLTISGNKPSEGERNYLYQGIVSRNFKRTFQLADHIEVTGANLINGLLTIQLFKDIPEAVKPKSIPINSNTSTPSNDASGEEKAA